MVTSKGRKVKESTDLRKQPFSKLFLDMAIGLSPLMAAVTFSRPSVITRLLEAGAPIPTGTKLFGESPCQFRGVFAGKTDNLTLILDRFPELACKVNQAGTTGMHFACMLSSGQSQCDVLEQLLAHGGAATLGTNHFALGTPLMVLSANPDADPAAVKILSDAADATAAAPKYPRAQGARRARPSAHAAPRRKMYVPDDGTPENWTGSRVTIYEKKVMDRLPQEKKKFANTSGRNGS